VIPSTDQERRCRSNRERIITQSQYRQWLLSATGKLMQQNTTAILYQICWENVAHHFKEIGSLFRLCDKELFSPYLHRFHVIQCFFVTAQGWYCMGNHIINLDMGKGERNNTVSCEYSCRKGSGSLYFSKEFGPRLWFRCCL